MSEREGDDPADLEPVELDGGHVFRMRTVHDVFRKLGREKQRFIDAGNDRRDQIDSVINFAVTAWHMADWIWDQHRNAVEGSLGIQSKSDFQRYLREQCPHLAACDVIANAAKHGGAAWPQDDRPDVETILVAHPIDADPNSPLEVQVVAMMDRNWSLRLRVNGRAEHARVLLERVTFFWHRFLQQWCGPRDVGAPGADDEEAHPPDPEDDA